MLGGMYQSDKDAIVGKKLKSVALANGDQELIFTLADGSTVEYCCEADCCSRTWIEDLTADDVDGATVLSVEDGGELDEQDIPGENSFDDTCVKFYSTCFHTDKSRIIVEYRNRSNGYYGGDLRLKRPA